MQLAWIVLLISAFTDLIITGGTSLMTAMVESESGQLPSWTTILIAVLGGLVAAARTIQQALKALSSPEALKGQPDPPKVGG